MKWIKFGILTLALAAVWASQVGLAWAYTISINQYVEHPSLNDSVLGFKEALAELGIEAVYLEHNAQKSIATVLQIVNLMKDERPDLILAVSTPSAQSTVQGIKDIPVLFTCVTDPVNAGLVASMEKPGGNVSGTTDMNPVADQVALIREIQPEAKNLGVIYNPGEPNSVVQVSLLKKVAEKQGFIVVEGVAPDTAG
ncbi:MAG: ABC transporter substrate-binding protein, partial [Deltaproteobacteria bacterium]|nr:ABC transporter substrate-binding protein [Deltaproteobacteria bacterium]